MIIKRTSPFTGGIKEIDLDITEEQYNLFLSGVHVQIAFPNLSPEDREFILSGITKEEWDQYIIGI